MAGIRDAVGPYETRKKADEGDASAQANRGLTYDPGAGAPKNRAEAVRCYPNVYLGK